MRTVTLKGISLKGKNRIREHGDTWKILSETSSRICVESFKNTNCCRWVDRKNDSDMEIIQIVETK